MSEIVKLKVVPTRRDDMLARIVAEIRLAHPDDRRELAYSLGQSLIELAFHGTVTSGAGCWEGGELIELTL